MRIALFHNLPSGGAKRAVFEWTQLLSKKHTIDVYTLTTADHEFYDIRPYSQNHSVYDFIPRRIYKSPFGRLNQLQRWRDLRSLTEIHKRIAREINTRSYDIFFANSCMYTFIPICLQFIDIPSLYYLHESFGRAGNRSISRPYRLAENRTRRLDRIDPLIKLYYYSLDAVQQKSMCATSLLVANSSYTQTAMTEPYGSKIFTNKLGVDTSSFYPTNIDKKNQILSVGELSPRKGFDFLITSLAQIQASERPKLIIAANNWLEPELEYLKSLAAGNQVQLEIKTKLDSDALNKEYNQAALCVYAPVLEPFGLVPLEAMAAGTPVVGVSEGGVAESIVHEKTGLLVERDPKKFADAITYLMRNPQIRSQYGASAREYVVNNWSWEKSTTSLEAYLHITIEKYHYA